jgi:hypothetical protein
MSPRRLQLFFELRFKRPGPSSPQNLRTKIGKSRGVKLVAAALFYWSQAAWASCRAAASIAFGQTPGERLTSCLASEQRTREELNKNWSTFPADDRIGCVKSLTFSPTYTELVTCLEMRRDVKKMRGANPPTPTRADHSDVLVARLLASYLILPIPAKCNPIAASNVTRTTSNKTSSESPPSGAIPKNLLIESTQLPSLKTPRSGERRGPKGTSRGGYFRPS